MSDNDKEETLEEQERQLSSAITPTLANRISAVNGIEPLGLAFSGKATQALAKTRTTGVIDKISQTLLTIGDVEVSSPSAQSLGVGEHKILLAGLQAFTRYNGRNERNPTQRVNIDLVRYASANGIDITEHQMDTPEEQEAEAKRAKFALDNFKKKLKKNLKNLNQSAITWTETVQGKSKAYNGMTLIGAYRVDSSNIMIEFTQSAAEYFVRLPLTPFPNALYLVDDRKPNAYSMGVAMCNHYAIDNNVMKDTERTMSVKSLLSYTNLPTIEKARESRNNWLKAIKEPFELALDELKYRGLITTWRYSYANQKELTDAEAADIMLSYEIFASLYIYYELANYQDHSERRLAIVQKKEENLKKMQEKASKAKAPKKKKNTTPKRSEA